MGNPHPGGENSLSRLARRSTWPIAARATAGDADDRVPRTDNDLKDPAPCHLFKITSHYRYCRRRGTAAGKLWRVI